MGQISCAVTADCAYVFTTPTVRFFLYLFPKFQTSSHLLWMHKPVSLSPGRKRKKKTKRFSCLAALSSDQRTTGPENAHLKPDVRAFTLHEKTLTLNTHILLRTSLVVCIWQVSGLRLQCFWEDILVKQWPL